MFSDNTAEVALTTKLTDTGAVQAVGSREASGVLSLTWDQPVEFDQTDAYFRIHSPGSVKLLAANLELGTQQTLCHKENGEWVLNEIPKYGAQLAECQRYQFINRGIQYSSIGSGFTDANGTKVKITAPISSMRTIPTIQFVGGIGITQPNGVSGAIQNPSILSWGQGCIVFEADCTGFAPNAPVFCYSDPDSYVMFDANL